MKVDIRNGKIVAVEDLRIGKKQLFLKKPIPIERYEELERVVSFIKEHFTDVYVEEWTDDELNKFLAECSPSQKEFLRTLAEKGVVTVNELMERIRSIGVSITGGRGIGAIAAGIVRKIRKYNKKEIFEKVSPTEWRILPEYQEKVREFFERQKRTMLHS
ncbi:MAG TPA: hypothetical protein ENF26_02860 [Methanomicrobia archaeon]|nr:hypothetical protein [Methanomicrobia archaeon]HEX59072.1 hypothetical protein [Methanomicrobia archaeon]